MIKKRKKTKKKNNKKKKGKITRRKKGKRTRRKGKKKRKEEERGARGRGWQQQPGPHRTKRHLVTRSLPPPAYGVGTRYRCLTSEDAKILPSDSASEEELEGDRRVSFRRVFEVRPRGGFECVVSVFRVSGSA